MCIYTYTYNIHLHYYTCIHKYLIQCPQVLTAAGPGAGSAAAAGRGPGAMGLAAEGAEGAEGEAKGKYPMDRWVIEAMNY